MSHSALQALGFLVSVPSGAGTTLALNAAATWLDFGYIPAETVTLNAVKVYCSAINGTQGNITCSMVVNGDTNGAPNNSAIAGTSTSTIAAGAWVAGGNWVEFTGFNCTLTAGTRYHFVIKNLSAVPGTDYPTFRYGGGNTWQFTGQSNFTTYGLTKVHTVDSGTTWASSPIANAWGMRLQFAASYDGTPVSNNGIVGAIYANREYGVLFTTPSNAKLSVIGLQFATGKSGTPTGNLRGRLYSGTTLLGTTYTIAQDKINTSVNNISLFFAAAITIAPGTALRAVLSETTQADAAGNSYRVVAYTIENSAESRALLPLNGTMQSTNTTDATATPIVWTNTNTEIIPMALILASGVFVAPTFPAITDVTSGTIYGFDSEYTGTKVSASGGGDAKYGLRTHRRIGRK